MININDLEKIIQVVDKFNISHFEFQHENSKVVIEKEEVSKRIVKESYDIQTNPVEAELLQPISKEDKNIKETIVEKEYIKANFAGTFYSGKETDGPTFVKLDDEVECDTVVALLEVMKLFNEVEAGVQGTIVDVLVKDGEFVEYGQPLFEIKSR